MRSREYNFEHASRKRRDVFLDQAVLGRLAKQVNRPPFSIDKVGRRERRELWHGTEKRESKPHDTLGKLWT